MILPDGFLGIKFGTERSVTNVLMNNKGGIFDLEASGIDAYMYSNMKFGGYQCEFIVLVFHGGFLFVLLRS